MPRGLPEIIIQFKTKATSAIERSERGIVMLILKDTEHVGESFKLESIEDVATLLLKDKNIDYVKKAMLGTPTTVLVEVINETGTEYTVLTALKKIGAKEWNYLAIPEATAQESSDATTWVKDKRNNELEQFKFISPYTGSDHEGIIDFITNDIQVATGDVIDTYSNVEYTARIAGLVAGLPMNRSCTYFVLPEVVGIKEHEDPNAEVEKGNLILINDGEKIKIARGVNSLVSFTTEKGETVGKIKTVEGMDMVQKDIYDTFEDSYIGKYINDYDNKQMFIAAVNVYFRELQPNVLDRNATNRAEINFQAQKNYLESVGKDVSSMNDMEILLANTGSKVFISSTVQFVDTMEDLYMINNM